MIVLTGAPKIHLNDQVLTTGEIPILNVSITGNPPSNLACSYRECPLIEDSQWPLFDQCQESRIVDGEMSQPSKDFVQTAKLSLPSESPGILDCTVTNSQGSENKSAYVYIRDREDILQIDGPVEVIVGYGTQISCLASRYNFTDSAVLKPSDERNSSEFGKFVLFCYIIHI